MSERATPRLESGDLLAHYRVEVAVGEGAMGTVYRAHDTSLDRTVGLKVLRPEVSKDDRFVKRFVREARAAARVSHPNLTHIYFIGEQDDRHFFAMEFIQGNDLQEIVDRDGKLDLDLALDILIQTARGLRAAHRAGVVHRDIKPSNLLLQDDGTVRITDFGLAKSLDADVHTTQAGLVSGTPTYMSPEQCRGVPVDNRTDIYALGLTAFFLLTGRRAFECETLGSMIDSQINEPLPPLTNALPDLPDEVEQAVRRMCCKNRDDRPADMDEVLVALEACRQRPVPPAPLATRIMAAFLDNLGLIGVHQVAMFGLAIALDVQASVSGVYGALSLAALVGAYHLGCETWWGTTIAKWMFGLRVTSKRGTKPKFRYLVPRLLIRYPIVLLAYVEVGLGGDTIELAVQGIQLAVVGAGVVTYFIASGRTLSDLLTATRVIPDVRQETSSSTK